MVPTLVHEIGRWLDQFTESLSRWESILVDLRTAYLLGDCVAILDLCRRGEEMQSSIERGKRGRVDILHQAKALGYQASNIKELSHSLDAVWPALWTHRIGALENQLLRVEQLSVSIWITAFQAQDFTSDMIRILSTGRSNDATYSPSELSSREGGYLINEAA
jgi:hypothetical protein